MQEVKSKHKIAQMFDQIADKYDLTNRVLSLGQDRRWRKKLRRHLPKLRSLSVVDLACGTGEQIAALLQKNASFIGIDISKEMLKIAKAKFASHSNVEWMLGSALAVPLDDACADVVTISFGIRNVSDPSRCLSEMLRILQPGGQALILEFSKPTFPFVRGIARWYTDTMVPWIGKKMTKKAAAYAYLPATIVEFPSGEAFLKMMQASGFINCHQETMNFGTVSLYKGERRYT